MLKCASSLLSLMEDTTISLASFITRMFPLRRALTIAIHLLLAMMAYYLAFLLRFDLRLPAEQWDRFLYTLPLLLLIRGGGFACFHLYGGLWRYVSIEDLLCIFKAVTLGSALFTAGILLVMSSAFPRSVLLIDWVLCLTMVGGVRLTIRAWREWSRRLQRTRGTQAVIVGAGDAAESLLREIERNVDLNYRVVGLVDDDPEKKWQRIHGVPVLESIDHLPELCREYQVQEILIAIPSASHEQRQRVLDRCRATGLPFKTVPALAELLQGHAHIGQLREVQPADLLGREPIRLDLRRLRRELQGRRILVTGAAGSIGVELCRQLASFEPETLVLFDRAESGLYFIDLELKRTYPGLRIVPIIGDILDQRKVEQVIQQCRPDLVYHAAAYKHVPLMEEHPLEAMENNIVGTEIVALAARAGCVKKFVLISTDKAVRPVGIMGMTKRMAECLVLCLDGSPTTFMAVRFGNVLGSDGSVLPLFRWQIAHGGPVTVTDPNATRYFMLPSEAAQLVLQAGAMGRGGEIFFLDMGNPVRILDLAHNLIRLSGMEPSRDIPVEVIGLRPGERLREELVLEREELLPSEHEKVFMVQNHSFDQESFQKDFEVLKRLIAVRDQEGAIYQLKTMVGRY